MKEKDYETWCAKNPVHPCEQDWGGGEYGWPRWPCFLWRKTPSWHKECPPYGGLLRSCFVLTILYSICNKWLHRTISKYFQVLGQNKIKVQPFKGATTSKEHRL
jgi:hypothetical protein